MKDIIYSVIFLVFFILTLIMAIFVLAYLPAISFLSTSDEETLKKALKDSWIVLLKNDITTSKDLVVEGDFTKPDKNDSSKMVPAGRTIALYENDDNNTTKSYTLTTPKITVKSKDTKIEGGTIIGDVYVEAEGFELENAKIEGNVYFSKQEYKDSFEMDDKSTVTGVQEVK